MPPASLADAANYIVDGSTVTLQMYGDEIVGSDLPAAVELNVTETEPGVQGDRVSGARKPATLETGLVAAGAAVREPGRPHQGRHPLGRVHHPRVSLTLAEERRDARERALGLLYEAETKGCTGTEVLGGPARRRPTTSPPRSVRAVDEHHERIDGLLAEHAKGWTLARMPALDRAALRMGTAELITRADVPTAVVLNETVELRQAVLHRRQRPLRQRPPRQDRHRGPPRVIPLPDPPLRSGDLRAAALAARRRAGAGGGLGGPGDPAVDRRARRAATWRPPSAGSRATRSVAGSGG